MKEFIVKNSTFSPILLLDDKGKLIGEILLCTIAGFNDRIKIDNDIFKIKYNSWFSRDFKIFDQNENLVFQSDISKDRFIYFGNEKEIFTYKSNGWFTNRLNLYRNEEFVISVTYKGFFKNKCKIEVSNNFDNRLVTLVFLHDYMSSQSS